jgi:hypothetical protein
MRHEAEVLEPGDGGTRTFRGCADLADELVDRRAATLEQRQVHGLFGLGQA